MTIAKSNQSITSTTVAKLTYSRYTQHWPPVYQTLSLGQLYPALKHAIQGAARIISEGKSTAMIIIGPLGTGKTSCLYLLWREIAKNWIDRYVASCTLSSGSFPKTHEEAIQRAKLIEISIRTQHPIRFLTHASLIRELRSSTQSDVFNEGAPVIPHSLRVPQVLFIDDFGRAFDDASGWNAALQFEFFDMCWQRRKSIFITTNLAADQLNAMGERWEAVIDRFADNEWMQTYGLKGDSLRRKHPPTKKPSSVAASDDFADMGGWQEPRR